MTGVETEQSVGHHSRAIVNICFGILIGLAGTHFFQAHSAHHDAAAYNSTIPASLPLLTEPVLQIIYLTVGILFFATIASVLYRLVQGRWLDDFAERVWMWWALVAVFTWSLYSGQRAVLWLWAGCSYLALKQFLSSIPTRRADRAVLLWVYLSIPVQYWLVASRWHGLFTIFVPVLMGLLLPFRMHLHGDTHGFLRACATLQWGMMACVYSLSHLPYLLNAPAASAVGPAGVLVFLVALTESSAVLHWFITRALEHLWPTGESRWRLAPNVTWPGLLLVCAYTTAAASQLAPRLTIFTHQHALLLGALVGVASSVGQITLEAVRGDVRRSLPLALLPAASHLGGVLERIYNLMYTAPLFFHAVRYLYKFSN